MKKKLLLLTCFIGLFAFSQQKGYKIDWDGFQNLSIGNYSINIPAFNKENFSFDLEDLTPVEYIAETLNYKELNTFIEREKKRGSSYINRYEMVRFKRWSLPISAYILTIIAVAVSSVKRRGGMGVNLAIGMGIGMIFIFFDKIFGTMAEQSDFSPIVASWFPNFIFAILAIYLLRNAKR